jgi:hypothetical protein
MYNQQDIIKTQRRMKLLFARKWVELEIILLSKISQIQISCTWKLGLKKKLHECKRGTV